MGGIAETLRNLGTARLLTMGVVAAALISGLLFLSNRLAAPNMALLYSELELGDSSQIVAKLEGMNVPFELRNGGTQVYVPADQMLRLRLSMAQEGLPAGGSIGYELFDQQDSLGTTSFVQNINHVRALEGELSRTIRTIDKVDGARVHLVLARRELFSREQRRPSASIILKMKGRYRLEPGQVQAIQHLISAAIPDLKPTDVSIIDDQGNLLSRRSDGEDGFAGGTLTDMRAAYEGRLKSAIESLVEQSVGVGNVRAEVSTDMNFDRITTNAETFDPESQVVRSTQTVEESSASSESDPQQGVTVANNLPEADANANGDATSSSNNQRVEETVNYEISKVIKTQVHETGKIQRLSVAVLIDGTYDKAADGTAAYVPRKQEELDQIAALVRSTIGFSEARGDKIEVVNMRFSRFDDEVDTGGDEPGFLGLAKHDMMRIGETVAFVLVAILTILLVLRPLIFRVFAPVANRKALPGGAKGGIPQLPAALQGMITDESEIKALLADPNIIAAIETGELTPGEARDLLAERANKEVPEETVEIDFDNVEGKVRASSIKKIGELVDQHPDEAVTIMRSWIYQEA